MGFMAYEKSVRNQHAKPVTFFTQRDARVFVSQFCNNPVQLFFRVGLVPGIVEFDIKTRLISLFRTLFNDDTPLLTPDRSGLNIAGTFGRHEIPLDSYPGANPIDLKNDLPVRRNTKCTFFDVRLEKRCVILLFGYLPILLQGERGVPSPGCKHLDILNIGFPLTGNHPLNEIYQMGIYIRNPDALLGRIEVPLRSCIGNARNDFTEMMGIGYRDRRIIQRP